MYYASKQSVLYENLKQIREVRMKSFVKNLVVHCVRNTFLEKLHAGIFPDSKTGDYSDVKVVSPYGEIPWNQLGRISDEEMKKLMKEIVNKVYTMLFYLETEKYEHFCQLFRSDKSWNDAKIDEDFREVLEWIKKKDL